MKKLRFASFVVHASFIALSLHAVEDPLHNELRALRDTVLDGINKGDIDRVLSALHTNVVVTWQNGDVCRGHAGVREHFGRLGKNAFKGYKMPPTADELTILYGGDAGVVFGGSVGQYDLLGKQFEFNNRWTATLVKDNGRWQIASYHVSLNALDNPILSAAKNGVFMMGGLALVLGLVAGVFIGKKRSAAPPAAGQG